MNDVDVDQLCKALHENDPCCSDPLCRRNIAEFLLARFIIAERGNQCDAVTIFGRRCEVTHPHAVHKHTLHNGDTFEWSSGREHRIT